MRDDLIERLADAAARHPDRLLYSFLDGGGREVERYSYRGLHQRSNHLAARLADDGRVRAGRPVLLVYPPGLEFIVAFFACAKLGAIPVPVPPPDSAGLVSALERLAHIAADCGATAVLTTDACQVQLRRLAARSPDATRWLSAPPLAGLDWLATDVDPGTLGDFAARPDALLFLQYTSGSTQSPRGVMVSHANAIHNAESTFDFTPVGVSWLPHYHDMGLLGYYLFHMLSGGTGYGFSSAHFLKRPVLWLETISRVRANLTCAPNFAYEYCLREDRVPDAKLEGIDLSSLHWAMNAAEPIRADTCARFVARFARWGFPAQALVGFYGLAENTLCVSGGGRVQVTANARLLEHNQLRLEAPRPDGYNQTRLVSSGAPRPGQDVRIVDPATAMALGEDRIGEVWVGGPSKAEGYYGQPTLSRELLQATLADAPEGTPYLRTGDIGFLHDGELFICGRLKDMIIVAGRNYHPSDLEAVVEQCAPQVRSAAAFAIEAKGGDVDGGEAIAVIVEAVRANDLPDLEEIARALHRRCQAEVAVLEVVAHGTIARTSSGKIARQETRRRWLAGDVDVLAARRRVNGRGDVLDELLARFDVAGYDDRTLADLGVDSLTLVELTVQIEAALKAQHKTVDRRRLEAVSDLRMLQAITVGELRELLRQPAALRRRIPKLAAATYARRLRAVEQDELAQMRRDTVLPADIIPAPAAAVAGGPLLLTGATGFLGAFMLEALLRLTDSKIIALVRADDAAHASARVTAALRRTGLFTETLRAAAAARVTALPGDLAHPDLGLGVADWAMLADTVSAIYHCGADVDYVKPYGSLRGANVTGTVALLRLAGERRRKPFHLVSTTFVFGFEPRAVCWEPDANGEMAGLNFGYAQSKWVAEALARAAGDRGLPVSVYRPSLVTASRTGRYARGDLVARLLGYMIRHGVAPTLDNQVSFLPVDVCANNIVALSRLGSPPPCGVHLVADRYYTMRTVCDLVSRQFGYAFVPMSLERTVDHVNAHCTRDDAFYPLKAFLNHNWGRLERMSQKRYDSRVYRTLRAQSPDCLAEPPLDETVAAIVTFLQREALVPAAPAPVARAARPARLAGVEASP